MICSSVVVYSNPPPRLWSFWWPNLDSNKNHMNNNTRQEVSNSLPIQILPKPKLATNPVLAPFLEAASEASAFERRVKGMVLIWGIPKQWLNYYYHHNEEPQICGRVPKKYPQFTFQERAMAEERDLVIIYRQSSGWCTCVQWWINQGILAHILHITTPPPLHHPHPSDHVRFKFIAF